MNLVFVGGIYLPEDEEGILLDARSTLQNAADALQKGFLAGFAANSSLNTVVINAPFMGSYPRRSKCLFFKPKKRSAFIDGIRVINLSLFNFAILKNVDRCLKVFMHLLREVDSRRQSRTVVVCYSMHLPFLLAIFFVRLIRRGVRMCVIVPDLPEFMASRGVVKRFLYMPFWRIAYAIVNSADSLSLISEGMADRFASRPKKAVVEAIATTTNDVTDFSARLPMGVKRFFLYSGTLDCRYGVRDLIRAFDEAKIKGVHLVICGDGPDREFVRCAAKECPEIIWLGQLKRAEVLFLQKKALALVNPRKNSSEYTKYSFPSKITEYMLSGSPVLMYRLDGIPEEYFRYCYVIGVAESSLREMLEQIEKIPMETLIGVGLAARKFVLEHKNPRTQVNKLISNF